MIRLSGMGDAPIALGQSRRSGRFAGSLGKRRLEESDPMAGVANLVDVMLVFACGLILALLVYWNIDMPNLREIQERREVTDTDDMQKISESIETSGSSFEELGMVYKDPETGKEFMVMDDEEGSGD